MRIDYEKQVKHAGRQAEQLEELRGGTRCLVCRGWRKPCAGCVRCAVNGAVAKGAPASRNGDRAADLSRRLDERIAALNGRRRPIDIF